MKNLFYFILFFFLTGCSGSGSDSSVPAETPDATADSVERTTEISQPGETAAAITSTERNVSPPQSFPKEFSAGKITFKIESPETERSASLVKVEGSGSNKFSKEFPVEGLVQNAFLLDLDKDGFSELYLVVASEGQLELKGYGSYRDQSAGEIYVKGANAEHQTGAVNIFVENGGLFQRFTKPDGAVEKLKYELSKGETSFILSLKASNDEPTPKSRF